MGSFVVGCVCICGSSGGVLWYVLMFLLGLVLVGVWCGSGLIFVRGIGVLLVVRFYCFL